MHQELSNQCINNGKKTDIDQSYVRYISIVGGNIPEDRFTYHRLMVQPNIPSLVLIMLANILCCLVALGFLGFNIYYRTKR